MSVGLLTLKLVSVMAPTMTPARIDFDGISSRLELREIEPALLVGFERSAQSSLMIRDGCRRVWNRRPSRIRHLAYYGAGRFPLRRGSRGKQKKCKREAQSNKSRS